VNKVEVQYDRTAKQVDVHLLKETLWDHIQISVEESQKVSFAVSSIVSTIVND